MGKNPAFPFYPGDWIQDTRILTPLTRGVWVDMLCFMWRSKDRGKLEMSFQQFARLLSCQKDEIETAITELSVTKIADVTVCNDLVTVINRRMYREERERILTRSRVARYRETEKKRESNASVTRTTSSSSSLKKESIKKEKIEFQQNHFLNIPDELMKKWEQIAPGISIAQELVKAEAWVLSNPKLKKSNWSRFLTNWIIRAQDHIGKYGGGNGNHKRGFSGDYKTTRDREEDAEAARINAEYERKRALKATTAGATNAQAP